MTTETMRAAVERAVKTEHGWEPGDIEIKEPERIRMPPCSFFSVTHKVRPVHSALNYAVLPDGGVVSRREKDAATKIFAACAAETGASAGSWAEVLARFHPEVGPGTVVYDQALVQEVFEPVEAAGKRFSPPAFVSGASDRTVEFYLMNYETAVLYEVRVVRKQNGQLQVTKTKAG